MKKVLAMLLMLCLLVSGIALAEEMVEQPKPTKVTLADSKTVTVYIDAPVELGYAVEPEGADPTLLKWSTSSKKIATVADGVVTPVKEGTATITVKTPNGKKDSVKVKVVDPYKPSKVELDRSGTITLKMDETLQLYAALQPETAKTTLKWSTSSKKIATVDANGVVTPVKEGTATITVQTANGKKDTVKVKVVDPYKPSKVVLDLSGTMMVSMGDTLNLNVSLEPETARTTLKWSSSNKKIATVNEDGVVIPVKEGTATITVATHNGKKDTLKVKVVDPYKPEKIELDKKGSLVMETGEQVELYVKLYPETAKTTLTWKSSNPKVASVDGNGLVTCHKSGSVSISVVTANGKKASVQVKGIGEAMPKPGYSNDLLGFLGRPVSELEDFVGKLSYDSKFNYVFELRGEISGRTSDQKYNNGWSGGRVIEIDLQDRSGRADGHTKKYTLAGINLENYGRYGRDERKVITAKLEKEGWKLEFSKWSASDLKLYRYVKTLSDRETGNQVKLSLTVEFVSDSALFDIGASATLVK